MADNGLRASPDELLANHDRLLRAVLDGTTDSVFVKDLAGRYRFINAPGARYLGRTPAEVLGKTDAELLPAETAQKIAAHDREVLQTGASRPFEVSLPIDGVRRVFLSTKTPYRDAQGRVVGLIGISRDIQERKQAEQALRESEERLARVLESAMDAIVTLDEQERICLFNAAAEDMFRCSAAEVLGQRFDRFASAPLRTMLARCRQAFARSEVKKRYVWVPGGFTAVRASGEEFPLEATISEVRTGAQHLLTLIIRDVNERKRAEDELHKLQLEKSYLQQEAQTSITVDEMVGESPGMQALLKSIEQVAGTDSTVLITGETGTGKELVARAIHTHSPRHQGLLVAVNCAALPAGLMESELFGHERGAFTGALARKAGRFEMAHKGTLLLDEIGDLPPELQAKLLRVIEESKVRRLGGGTDIPISVRVLAATNHSPEKAITNKLLRVLQEGEFERVGGTETLKVDVRVIAATHRDLEQEVTAERFREDLYYRLNVFPIQVPALRERPEDIPLLARHFALHYGRKMGKPIAAIPTEVVDALLAYDWPGNVRELENVIERAVIISCGGTLALGEWPPPQRRGERVRSPAKLAEAEREHILKALEATRWRVSGPKGAAALLGLKPTTLESRMKKLGLSRP